MPARNEGLIRSLRLIAALRHPRTIEDLAGIFDVTTRTIRRDLDTLKAVGIRVWKHETERTYRLSRPEMRVVELAGCHLAEAQSGDERQALRRA